jgi:tetratricopeptide (TPR) repeat protein
MSDRMAAAVRLYRTRRYEQALTEFQAVDAEPADSPELSYYIGLCYTKLQRYEDALSYLEQVVTSSLSVPHVYQCRMVLAYIYAGTGRHRLAEFELQKVLESGYESVQAYAALGYVYYAAGKVEASIEILKKAVKLEPRNANALNSLGYILAEEGTNLDMAVAYCKRAVQLNPEHPPYLDSLGWAFYQQGRVDEALAYLRRALKGAPHNRDIAAHVRAVVRQR